MKVIVESSGHIFAYHTLPLSFTGSKISFIFFQVFHELKAYILLEQLFRFFKCLFNESSSFYMKADLLLTMSLTIWIFMSLCRILKGGRSASGSFTYYSYSSSYMLVIYFEYSFDDLFWFKYHLTL